LRDLTARALAEDEDLHPVVPHIPGLIETGFETNETVMDMEQLPVSLVVIGGGPEGMEFSQFFHRFGVRVTLPQRRGRVLPREDEEISHELETILREEGIDIRTNARPTQVGRLPNGDRVVSAELEGREQRFERDRILVAAGRRPHALGDLDLDAAGIEGDPERGIDIDRTLRSSAPNVWAIGDVMGRMQYTHFAF
jgi:pyruvate/2-oxoglutarate dehydrogenase complex dihydrolipoamide dehydrogenase (E3) component